MGKTNWIHFAFDNYVPKHAPYPPGRTRTRRRTKTRVTPHKKCQVFIDGNATKERHDGDGNANTTPDNVDDFFRRHLIEK